jgi:hypothetical protein
VNASVHWSGILLRNRGAVADRDFEAISGREANDDWLGHPDEPATDKIIGHCPHCGGGVTTWDRLCWPQEWAECPYHACGESFEWDEVK